jgi:hypothetical protein
VAAEAPLIREYSIRSCFDVQNLSQQMNSASHDGWQVFDVVPDGRLYLLIVFRIIPRPAARRLP